MGGSRGLGFRVSFSRLLSFFLRLPAYARRRGRAAVAVAVRSGAGTGTGARVRLACWRGFGGRRCLCWYMIISSYWVIASLRDGHVIVVPDYEKLGFDFYFYLYYEEAHLN